MIREAADHVAIGEELLNQLMAVKSFELQQLLDRDKTAEEVIDLVTRFKAEMEEASASIDQFLKSRQKCHCQSSFEGDLKIHP